jgi:hypothetical protein
MVDDREIQTVIAYHVLGCAREPSSRLVLKLVSMFKLLWDRHIDGV